MQQLQQQALEIGKDKDEIVSEHLRWPLTQLQQIKWTWLSRDQSYRQPHFCVSMVLVLVFVWRLPQSFLPCSRSGRMSATCPLTSDVIAAEIELRQRCSSISNRESSAVELDGRRTLGMGSDEKMKNTTRSMPGLASTVEMTRLLKPCSMGPIGTARSWTFY
jgi:hypothetical protein